jgi:hypothetical protein
MWPMRWPSGALAQSLIFVLMSKRGFSCSDQHVFARKRRVPAITTSSVSLAFLPIDVRTG